MNLRLATVGGVPCALLLAGDPASVLGTGGLYEICDRPVGPPPVDTDPPPGQPRGTAGFPVASASSSVETRLLEEDEDKGQPQRGFFFTLGYDSANRDESKFKDGFTSYILRLGAGFDWAVGNAWTLGVAADASEQKGDVADGGNFTFQTLGLTGFGSYRITDSSSIDFYAGYSNQSNERLRPAKFTYSVDLDTTITVSGTPIAKFDADQLITSVQYSYDWHWNRFTLGPRLGYDWSETNFSTYSETDDSGLALTFHNDKETSSQFSGGLAGTAAIGTNFGAVLIGGSVLYRYERDLDQRNVEISFVEDTRAHRFSYQTAIPDREFIDYFASATFVVPNGLQIFLVYRGISSHDFLDVSAGTLGFRKEF